MKKNPENLPVAISGRAVPLGFNLESNRYPQTVVCHSDCTDLQAWFYEYHGLYWYSVTIAKTTTLNSVGFLSVQNCISEFRAFLRGYGFVFRRPEVAESRLRELRCSVKPPKSWVV